jgi:ATP-dependent Clp protease adaptor protein ClpS
MSTEKEKKSETMVKSKTDKPSKYKVYILNDDFTPMDFVVQILIQVFNKDLLSAESLTRTIHEKQKALIGIYTKDVAEYRVNLTMQLAKNHGYPLKSIMEKE